VLPNKKTPVDEQVAMAAGWIRDNLIQNWYWLSEECFNTMTMDTFIKEMRGKWLKTSWEAQIQEKILGSRQDAEPF
jgi:hypothetical protein